MGTFMEGSLSARLCKSGIRDYFTCVELKLAGLDSPVGPDGTFIQHTMESICPLANSRPQGGQSGDRLQVFGCSWRKIE